MELIKDPLSVISLGHFPPNKFCRAECNYYRTLIHCYVSVKNWLDAKIYWSESLIHTLIWGKKKMNTKLCH